MKPTISSPHDLFFDQLKDLHSMELQISRHLPELVAKVMDDRLRDHLAEHSAATDQQLNAITELFRHHGLDPGHDKCKAIAGLIDGGNAHLATVDQEATRDLMVVAHSLRIEHYEIAAYEIASRLAGQLGLVDEAGILMTALQQESNAADILLGLQPSLFQIAEGRV
jgi:ferritin-like metal-binding protein YciE